MVFTRNKKLRAWGDVLHDHDLAEVILDRVLERGQHIVLGRRSYRLVISIRKPSPAAALQIRKASGNHARYTKPIELALRALRAVPEGGAPQTRS